MKALSEALIQLRLFAGPAVVATAVLLGERMIVTSARTLPSGHPLRTYVIGRTREGSKRMRRCCNG